VLPSDGIDRLHARVDGGAKGADRRTESGWMMPSSFHGRRKNLPWATSASTSSSAGVDIVSGHGGVTLRAGFMFSAASILGGPSRRLRRVFRSDRSA